MPDELPKKKAAFFFDGQNLHRAAQKAFNRTHPDYDPLKLISLVCLHANLECVHSCFYTGVPSLEDNAHWNKFWSGKLLTIHNSGVGTFTRTVKYRTDTFSCPQGHTFERRVGAEKGIDVRIAIDMVRLARRKDIDAIVVFSQDQDLSEAFNEVRQIAADETRFIHLYSVFPLGSGTTNKRGINGSNWIPVGELEYSYCIDENEYDT